MTALPQRQELVSIVPSSTSRRIQVPASVTYRWKAAMEVLDLCIENGGFIYVLSIDRSSASRATTLDIYRPDGSWLLRQENLDVRVLTVDTWRSMFTMNGGSTNQFGFRNYIPEPAITFWTL